MNICMPEVQELWVYVKHACVFVGTEVMGPQTAGQQHQRGGATPTGSGGGGPQGQETQREGGNRPHRERGPVRGRNLGRRKNRCLRLTATARAQTKEGQASGGRGRKGGARGSGQ